MLLAPIGKIKIDKEKLYKTCNRQTGVYDSEHDILSRDLLTGSNFSELNSNSFCFNDEMIRPLLDIEQLYKVTGADRSAPSRLLGRLQMPGCFTPPHVDWMQTYSKKIKKQHTDRRRRWWIAVDDYIPGQVVMHDDYIIAHYKSGDVYSVNFKKKHCGVNASVKDRYYITFTALSGSK